MFTELRGLVLNTMGLAKVLQAALVPLTAQIDLTFVYGSVAKQQDTAHSDIDVLIVSSDWGYADVFGALEPATTTLGRKINPTLDTPSEVAKRIQNDNAFITRVFGSSPKFG